VRACVVVALMGMAATGRRAHAESAEAQVERLAADAVNAYRGADYNRAIELLQRAYEIRQVPALLYNMAKAYDRLGDVEHAYDAYRRYSDSADADPRLKSKADARLATLEEIRRKKAAAQRAVEPRPQAVAPAQPKPAPTPAPAPLEPPRAQPPTAEQIKQQLKDERQRDRRRDRYIALGVGAGAVAFAGVAVGLSVDALQLHDRWAAEYGGDEAARRQLEKTAVTRAAIADGFYAATAVVAGIGAYFLYRGFRPEPTAPSLALLPLVTPAGGGLVAAGRF
jgi:hypothetical protein